MRRHRFKVFGVLTAIGLAIEYSFHLFPAYDGAQEFVQRLFAAAIVAGGLMFLLIRVLAPGGPRPSS